MANNNFPSFRFSLSHSRSLSLSRPIGGHERRRGGAPLHSHGDPLLSCPQAADGHSGGPQLSEPGPPPQLRNPAHSTTPIHPPIP